MSRPYPMDHVDTAFFSVDTDGMPQTIAAVCLLDRAADWKKVEARVASALQQFPRLREKVVRKPRLAWQEDPDFDLANHLAVVHLPKIKDRQELLAEAGKIISRRLDMTLPPWRLVQVTGDDNLACVVLCLHHGSADGVRAVRLLDAISSDSPTRSCGSPLEPEELSPPTSKGWLASLSHGLKCSRKLIAEGLIPCSASPLNGDTSGQRSVTPVDLSRRELARVMRLVDASLQDVLYTVVAGAIRIYHDQCGAANNDMRVVVPMAVPPRSRKGGLGNHLVLSTLTLPVSEPDALERLNRVREMFSRMKTDGTIGAYEFAAAAIHRFVPGALHRKIWETMIRKTNLVCTILPGPPQARYLGGARIEGFYGVPAPVVGHGAAFAFVSYAGRICGSIVTDENVIYAPSSLADCLKTSLRQLCPDSGGDPTHPLLGRSLSLPGDDLMFEGSIRAAPRSYLGDYSLYDRTLAPTGILLDILLAAATTTLNESGCAPNQEAPSAPSLTRPIRLEEVVLGQPLCLSSQHDRTIQTTVIRRDSSRWIQVSSLAEDDSWNEHATAAIFPGDEPQRPPDVAIDQLRARCRHAVPIADFYRECSERHVDYRAGLKGLRELWQGENEALALAEIPECLTDAGDYHFHPALLEACLQVAISGSSDSPSGQALRFDGVNRVDVYGRPDAHVWSHATFGNDGETIRADVELFTPEGRCIARLEGLRLLATSRESLFSDQGREESGFGDQVRNADATQRRQLALSHVRTQVAHVLGWSAPEQIRLRDRLFDLGIDSMMAIDLHRRLQTTMRLTLPEMLVFDYPTVEALADYLLGQIGDTARHSSAAGEPVEDLGALSENELADLLQEELDS